MSRDTVHAPDAPAAVGPYSHGVRAGDVLYLSGQTPIDPATGRLVDGDVANQTARVFANLSAVLAAAGLTLDDVVKVNVYLVDMADFAAMNQVYASVFADPDDRRGRRPTARGPGRDRGRRLRGNRRATAGQPPGMIHG